MEQVTGIITLEVVMEALVEVEVIKIQTAPILVALALLDKVMLVVMPLGIVHLGLAEVVAEQVK